jgi:hypothetical protein
VFSLRRALGADGLFSHRRGGWGAPSHPHVAPTHPFSGSLPPPMRR